MTVRYIDRPSDSAHCTFIEDNPDGTCQVQGGCGHEFKLTGDACPTCGADIVLCAAYEW